MCQTLSRGERGRLGSAPGL